MVVDEVGELTGESDLPGLKGFIKHFCFYSERVKKMMRRSGSDGGLLTESVRLEC